MMLIGTVIGGWQLARGALVALEQLAAGGDKAFLRDAGGDGAVLRRARVAAHAAATQPRSAPAARSTMALSAEDF